MGVHRTWRTVLEGFNYYVVLYYVHTVEYHRKVTFLFLCYRYGEKQRRADSQELSGIQLLSATAYQLKKPYQQLLIPITVWIGMEQAFIGADFTQVSN